MFYLAVIKENKSEVIDNYCLGIIDYCTSSRFEILDQQQDINFPRH